MPLNSENTASGGYDLGANYPNPFHPVTAIPVILPEEQDVIVEVYDQLGQRIRTLYEGHLEAGTHNFYWDARTQDNVEASSGVYIYKMSAGEFHATRTMVLAK
ncbi:MAG: hypothetical protein CL946_00180 [Ectothiorhodospiraceae bacterium]|nr:hypothetical protein [Ectothiorhodospiraceae bacterium]